MSTTRVLVTGTRWSAGPMIESVLGDYYFYDKFEVLIHGGGRGVDQQAADWARRQPHAPGEKHTPAIEIIEVPADWSEGPSAGPRRNQQMIEEHKPTIVLAFPAITPGKSPVKSSPGTWDTIMRAARAGIRIRVCPVHVSQRRVDEEMEAWTSKESGS